MRSRQAFLPPKNNRAVEGLIKLILPWVFDDLLKGLKVRCAKEDLEKLRQYRGERMLLLPNHPTGEDPYVLFEISRRLNESFNYVAAREIFDFEWGLRGWILQHCGSYSIIRGKADRESFKMTKELLVQGLRRLAIFIEGEVSNENDTIIPFEAGVIQLAFRAQEELARRHGEAFPPIYVAPVALKYYFHKGVEKAIAHSLHSLEDEVGIYKKAPETYDRILAIGNRILTVHEKQMNLSIEPEMSLGDRIRQVKNRLLKKMELFLEITPSPEESYLNRVRAIRNQMDQLIYAYNPPEKFSNYEARMLEHLRKTFDEFYDELERLVNFMTLDEGYLRDNWTNERFIELLRRLEKEVFGSPRIQYPRTCVVKVGEVINFKECYPAYLQNKRQIPQDIAGRLEGDMCRMLQTIERPGKL